MAQASPAIASSLQSNALVGLVDERFRVRCHHATMNLFSFFRRPKPKIKEHVTFTDEAVTRVRPDGVEEMIRWDDLYEVGILTSDEGPLQEDVFFLLVTSNGRSGCVVPQSSDGSKQLLERLQQLPGFDNEAVIKAMGSTANAQFVCWKRRVA